jgi:hypothetical protein
MTKEEFNQKLASRIGWQVIAVFGLEDKQCFGNMIKTNWGVKTPQGIGETILSIVRNETEQTESELKRSTTKENE